MCRPCSVVQRTDRELHRLVWQASFQPGCRPKDDSRVQRYHKGAEQEGSWSSTLRLPLCSLMLPKLLLENGLDFSYLLNELLAPPATVPHPLLSRSELSRSGTPGMSGDTPLPLPPGPTDSTKRPPRSRERRSSNVSARP